MQGKLILIGATMLGSAVAVSCGGGDAKSPASPEPADTQATEILETPLAPEPTQTVEAQLPTPSFEEASQLISAAYAGRTFSEGSEVTLPEFQTASGVIALLEKCLSNGETISTGSLVFEPGTPNYRTALLGGCQRAGQATSEIYKLTGQRAAYEANQAIFGIFKSVVEQVRNQEPAVADPAGYIDAVKQQFFITEPPE